MLDVTGGDFARLNAKIKGCVYMQSFSGLLYEEKKKIFEKECWKKRCDLSTLTGERKEEYLANRLDAALDDGIAIGRKIERQMIVARFEDLLEKLLR